MTEQEIKQILDSLGIDFADEDARDGAIGAIEAILKARQGGEDGPNPNAQEMPDELTKPKSQSNGGDSDNDETDSEDGDEGDSDNDSKDGKSGKDSKNKKSKTDSGDDQDGEPGDDSEDGDDDSEDGEDGEGSNSKSKSKSKKDKGDSDDGDDGEDGEDGESGDSEGDGDDEGQEGEDGKDGQSGKNGQDEEDGEDGQSGQDGGDDSSDEQDGEDSQGSQSGEDSKDGQDSQDGGGESDDNQDGKDGDSNDGDTSDLGDNDSQGGDSSNSDGTKNADDEKTNDADSTNKEDEPKESDWNPDAKWRDQELVKQRSLTKSRTIKLLKDALAKATTDGLSDKVAKINDKIAELEALQEAANNSLYDISDEKFRKLIDDSIDLAQSVLGNEVSTKSDETKMQQIKQAQNKLEQEADALTKEIDDELKAEKRAEATSEREKARIARQNSIRGGLVEFKKSLLSTLALQIRSERQSDDSWNSLNQRYDGTGILAKGKLTHDVETKTKPVINLYFDNSGSWGPDKIAKGKEVVAMMAELEHPKDGSDSLIKLNLYGFHNGYVMPIENFNQLSNGSGDTNCWKAIIKDIKETEATNVIIMTDGDMEGTRAPATANVRGCVWYLWCNNEKCPNLVDKLTGRGGTFQYVFYTD